MSDITKKLASVIDSEYADRLRESGKKDAEIGVQQVINLFDDSLREGLEKTPYRYVKFLEEFMRPEPFEFTTFEGEDYDQMVTLKDIDFYSLCEHHLAPFFGKAHVAYIPNKRIVGISKLPRTVDMFARRFQNQERITTQIANYINEKLSPKGVMVVIEAEHLCMAMRGIKKAGTTTVTSKIIGEFQNAEVRNEFLTFIKS